METTDCNGEIYDYYQEFARSGFADMLHDTERNHKYAIALKESIEKIQKSGKKAHVLDIGTGSGLLAMLAARYGADSVVTIEAYSPVTNVAREVITRNGFKDKIKIISKHSTKVQIGIDMAQKANILVAEVFDTELIGEGAIWTYRKAHENLIEEDCICVPDSSRVWVQIVDSDLCRSWYEFKDFIVDGEKILTAPKNISECPGLEAVHDIQLSQFPLGEFKPITEPFVIAEFDFSGSQIPLQKTKSIEFRANDDAESTTIFFWWELNMNQSGSIKLSCAPHWAHPDTDELSNHSTDEILRRNSIPWRDHWMQACFHLQNKPLKKKNTYYLLAKHDEFSWGFEIHLTNEVLSFEMPDCKCLYHYNSKNWIMQLNDTERRDAFVRLFKKLKGLKNMLLVGDLSMMPLVAAKMGCAEKILTLQENWLVGMSLKNFIYANDLEDKIEVINQIDSLNGKLTNPISHVIIDPNFTNAVDPLQNIVKFLTIIKDLISQANIFPSSVAVFAVPVHFLHLHKIRWPLKSSCEGFGHENFDSVLENSSKIADENVEPFSLWEYPCHALGNSTCVFNFDVNAADSKKIPNVSTTKLTIDDFSKTCNGIAFWIEWKLDDGGDENNDIIISSGPKTPIRLKELINWKFDRQTVHLIPYKDVVQGVMKSIDIDFKFNDEKISLDFEYHY